MALDNEQQQPAGSFVRLWQALFASVVHLFTRIFQPSSSSTTTPPPPPQQQHNQEPSAQPALTLKPPGVEQVATASGGGQQDALSRGQTIRKVPPDISLESNAELSHTSQAQEPSEDTDGDMAGGRGRGGGGHERPNGGKPYRNPSTHSQRSLALTTGGTNGVIGTSLSPSFAHAGASAATGQSSPNAQAAGSRPVSAGSSASVTRASVLGQGSTNVANDIVNGGKSHAAGSAAATGPAAVVPQVKLTPSNEDSNKAQSQDRSASNSTLVSSSAQKENIQPGYTAAASHVPPASATDSGAGNGALAAEQKPNASQGVPPLQEARNGTTDVSKLAGEEATIKLPTPIVVPLPYTMKPIPPKLLGAEMPGQILPGLVEPKTPEERAERDYHLKYMRAACDMGQLALETNETPVGCVLVWKDQIIAKGMNATNITRNGTRHAEFMALSALLSRKEKDDVESVDDYTKFDESTWGDVDPKDGHIFPYGQKLHPAPVVNRSIISECTLYVTVEPCVMCASLLRQLRIKEVYFGAVNDKFGGTGGVFRINMNSKPVPRPTDRPYQNGYGPAIIDKTPKNKAGPTLREDDDGDGGNVEPGFPAHGGFMRDEAVSLLRRFYVQENGRAPQPRKKEGRAARLFAMEAEAQALKSSASELSDTASAPQTPADTDFKEFPPAAVELGDV
ncbi:tRNA-specific adenosine deaminase 2 [Microdochium nivale]|nr:tRNA-specific adenosine deaminase 2 [Microdochium nivale]